jgi:hypothetical protein
VRNEKSALSAEISVKYLLKFCGNLREIKISSQNARKGTEDDEEMR